MATGFNHVHRTQGTSEARLFTVPETLLGRAKRIMSLTVPTEKMSKSAPQPRSRILITDSREEIRSKVMAALSDNITGVSFSQSSRPGVTNLIQLLYHFDESVAKSPRELANDLKDLSVRALKEKVVDAVDDGIKDVRGRYEVIMGGDPKVLEDIAEDGAQRAGKIAEETMVRVRSAMGLY